MEGLYPNMCREEVSWGCNEQGVPQLWNKVELEKVRERGPENWALDDVEKAVSVTVQTAPYTATFSGVLPEGSRETITVYPDYDANYYTLGVGL